MAVAWGGDVRMTIIMSQPMVMFGRQFLIDGLEVVEVFRDVTVTLHLSCLFVV